MINVIEKAGFMSMANRAKHETDKRLDVKQGLIKFRNPFLRATLGGIIKNDTILIGAETGVGKTQIASEIAEDAAKSGKRVFVFALEADTNEWERRRKFGVISDLYKRDNGNTSKLDYQDWMMGDLPELDQYEDEANKVMYDNHSYANIYTYYKDGDFGLDQFVKMFSIIDAHADLVIVDHIHYFDLFGPNHNEELEKIMKKIRQLTQTLNIPVILIAHLRKLANGQDRKLLPDISDFHGSSELSKVCTRAIMLSSGGYSEEHKGYITYIKAVKNRWSGSRTKTVGRIIFDPSCDRYNDDLVQFGYESHNQFVPFDVVSIPQWLNRKID